MIIIDNNSIMLIEKFHKIAKKGYIKGVSNTWGNIGLTFENEIGKLPDSEYTPDYNDIEIKCTTRFSQYPLYLFTLAFDSGENEAIRLAEKYGSPDKDYPDKYVLFERIGNKSIHNKYNYKFEIDKENSKLYLCVFDSCGNLIEKSAYVNYSSIFEHINIKLNKLAYIKASSKLEYNQRYYRYYALYLLKIKGFNTFIDLIQNNKIRVEIISRLSKSGEKAGKYKCKNLVFSIYKENIPLLFDCYYQYNYDNNY